MTDRSLRKPTSLELRTLEAIDRDTLLTSLQELVRTPSHGGQESAAQRIIARQMAERGLTVDVWEADQAQLTEHASYSVELEREEILGVVGAMGQNEGRTLILNGHIDVVPPGDGQSWDRSPWSGELEGGRVHGRGSVDMKGGLAAGLAAVKAIVDAGMTLRGQLLFESVVGEEDGGVGTLATIMRGYRADGAVIMEPTGLSVIPVTAGSLSFRITVRGRAAHGALRTSGVSAVEKFIPILDALRCLEAERNASVNNPLLARYDLPYPISVGKLRAGTWASSVPDVLVCEGRYGIAPGESLDEARAQLEELVTLRAENDPWLSKHPPEVQWWGGVFAPASTPIDDPVVSTLRTAGREVLGADPPLAGMTAATDLRLLVHEGGTPGVLFGPGDLGVAHAPNEAVPLEEVVSAAKVLALTILRFCNADRAHGPIV